MGEYNADGEEEVRLGMRRRGRVRGVVNDFINVDVDNTPINLAGIY